MPVDATAQTMRANLDAFLARGDFADYYTDDVTWATVGADQELQGRQPVRDFLSWMHTQAFDAHPKVKTLIIADGQAALEADFVGTHIGEFLGMPPTGKSVQVPTAWSTTYRTIRSRPCAPTSPWTCSPNSSSDQVCRGPSTTLRTSARAREPVVLESQDSQ
jgi:predicted ester cyclase